LAGLTNVIIIQDPIIKKIIRKKIIFFITKKYILKK